MAARGDDHRQPQRVDSPAEAADAERERRATIESIKRGLADIAAGRARPARDVLDELRRKILAG